MDSSASVKSIIPVDVSATGRVLRHDEFFTMIPSRLPVAKDLTIIVVEGGHGVTQRVAMLLKSLLRVVKGLTIVVVHGALRIVQQVIALLAALGCAATLGLAVCWFGTMHMQGQLLLLNARLLRIAYDLAEPNQQTGANASGPMASASEVMVAEAIATTSTGAQTRLTAAPPGLGGRARVTRATDEVDPGVASVGQNVFTAKDKLGDGSRDGGSEFGGGSSHADGDADDDDLDNDDGSTNTSDFRGNPLSDQHRRYAIDRLLELRPSVGESEDGHDSLDDNEGPEAASPACAADCSLDTPNGTTHAQHDDQLAYLEDDYWPEIPVNTAASPNTVVFDASEDTEPALEETPVDSAANLYTSLFAASEKAVPVTELRDEGDPPRSADDDVPIAMEEDVAPPRTVPASAPLHNGYTAEQLEEAKSFSQEATRGGQKVNRFATTSRPSAQAATLRKSRNPAPPVDYQNSMVGMQDLRRLQNRNSSQRQTGTRSSTIPQRRSQTHCPQRTTQITGVTRRRTSQQQSTALTTATFQNLQGPREPIVSTPTRTPAAQYDEINKPPHIRAAEAGRARKMREKDVAPVKSSTAPPVNDDDLIDLSGGESSGTMTLAGESALQMLMDETGIAISPSASPTPADNQPSFTPGNHALGHENTASQDDTPEIVQGSEIAEGPALLVQESASLPVGASLTALSGNGFLYTPPAQQQSALENISDGARMFGVDAWKAWEKSWEHPSTDTKQSDRDESTQEKKRRKEKAAFQRLLAGRGSTSQLQQTATQADSARPAMTFARYGAEYHPQAQQQSSVVDDSYAPLSALTLKHSSERERLRQARKSVRDELCGAWLKRENARKILQGGFTLDKTQAFDAAHDAYDAKRRELAALYQDGELNMLDREAFPRMTRGDTSAPKFFAGRFQTK